MAWHGMAWHGMHRPRSARFARRQQCDSVCTAVGCAQSVGGTVVVLAYGSVPSGANSSVGAAVIQLAALRGINTINIVRRRPEPENSAVSAWRLVAFTGTVYHTVPCRASCIVCRVASCAGGTVPAEPQIGLGYSLPRARGLFCTPHSLVTEGRSSSVISN